MQIYMEAVFKSKLIFLTFKSVMLLLKKLLYIHFYEDWVVDCSFWPWLRMCNIMKYLHDLYAIWRHYPIEEEKSERRTKYEGNYRREQFWSQNATAAKRFMNIIAKVIWKVEI